MPAALYLVATPIGNLEDITLRALRVLREADLIACEDTRQTGKLLAHFGIDKPMVSYHEHNEAARTAELVAKLVSDVTVALVSDAGTPLVSDPGYRLVTAAIGAGIPVVPIPGASAVLGALAAAGLPTDAFRFCGFLPVKTTQRRKVFEQLRGEDCTLVFYEAPHRILDALADLAAVYGDRPVAVARELTKLHEEFLRGTAEEIRVQLAARPSVKGEITLIVGKGRFAPLPANSVEDAVRELEQKGVPRMDAIKQVARERGLSKREVYKQIM
ncbi:MAG TPA: 16S rRNA (cytidine(1402)-2'-O)-methyltransferase [Bryobacteraceae bacterium]|nr:16S rRNA (cytidine(1402)-2'-O)-methyltransferase [Bryobacteraceae bacterium]